MHKSFLLTAFILGGLSVVLGAFGSHALKQLVSSSAINTFETGVRYQFYHVFALAVTAIVYKDYANSRLRWAGGFFITGIALFSGSLYILTFFNAAAGNSLPGIVILTPVGGLCFILGWIFLILGVVKKNF